MKNCIPFLLLLALFLTTPALSAPPKKKPTDTSTPIDTLAPIELLVNKEKPKRAADDDRPNIVIVFTDDQGYGDLGCYGAKGYETPRIDSLAKDGTNFTNFYVETVCGPSRSALLSGRLAKRSGGWGMPASEITFAKILGEAGYTTACIGKWDVSSRKPILDRMPLARGFDYYWGTLGANDGGGVRLTRNNEPWGATRKMESLSKWYTDQGIAFIRANKDKPFVLYLAHTMMHKIINASPEFIGKSEGSLWGDTLEELDFHTGRLLDTIDELGLRKNTLVIFTCDNGPWSNMLPSLDNGRRELPAGRQATAGSPGPLRGAKGSTYEGGMRVPCLVRWPGKVPAGRVCDSIFASIDFLPTFANLAGCKEKIPTDRTLDGVDQTDLLLGKSKGNRDHYYYFRAQELQCVRQGNWKLRLPNLKSFHGYVKDRGSQEIELYDLNSDLGEKNNVAAANPKIVAKLKQLAEDFPAEKKK